MSKKLIHVSIILLGALFWVWGGQAAHAQTSTPRPTPTSYPTATPVPGPTATAFVSSNQAKGSIRGTVYQDVNKDNVCNDADKVLAGVPIKFVSQDGLVTLYLQSGADGTYGLVAAGYGTWKVTAEPAAPLTVVSTKTVDASISSVQLVALNVNFCVKDSGTGSTGGTGTGTSSGGTTPVVLPNSGAAIAPKVIAVILAGLALVGLGSGIEWYRRRHNA